MRLKQLFKYTLHDMMINIFIIVLQMCAFLSVRDTDLCTCVTYINTRCLCLNSHLREAHGSHGAHMHSAYVFSEWINYSSVIIRHVGCAMKWKSCRWHTVPCQAITVMACSLYFIKTALFSFLCKYAYIHCRRILCNEWLTKCTYVHLLSLEVSA